MTSTSYVIGDHTPEDGEDEEGTLPDGVSRLLHFAGIWGRRTYAVRWSLRDTITYAIATGADAHNGRDLVWEAAPGFRALPTFATRFASTALVDFAAGTQDLGLLSFARASRVRLHRTLAAECGDAVATATLDVAEHSSDRTVLRLAVQTTDAAGPIADSTLDVHFRLQEAPRPRRPSASVPDHSDAAAWTAETQADVRPYQAALFRTLLRLTVDGRARDDMHVDPVASRELGLSAPVLPGEVTLGLVARLAMQNAARLGVGELRSVSVAHLHPVSDDDHLTVGFASAGEGTVRTEAVNSNGRLALRGDLHFSAGDTGSDHRETS